MSLRESPAVERAMPHRRPAAPSDRAPTSARPRRRFSTHYLDLRVSPYLYVLPFFVLFAAFGLFPLLYTAWVSLHDWDLISAEHPFVGLDNYVRLLSDRYFWNSVFNTAGIFVVATVPQLLAALGLASLLNTRMRGRTFFRMGVLLPNITSVAAVTIIFSQLYSRDFGLVNWLLGLIGIDPIHWQSGRWTSWLAIATMVDWRWTGYNALIYLAGLQAIPGELYEAAAIDGAGPWRRFWTITVPLLRPTIIFTVIISTIGGMQLITEPMLFDENPAAATGGSGRQFQTVALYLYENAFKLFKFGYASAVAWVLFLLIAGVAALNYALTRRISSTR